MHARDLVPVAHDRCGFAGLGAEAARRSREIERRRPAAAVERVVVAVHHEAGDACIGQFGEPVAEPGLAEEGRAGDLEHVAGDDHEVDAVLDRGTHHVAPRGSRGAAKDGENLGRRLGGQALDWAVEVQVTSVEKSKGLQRRHGPPSIADEGDSSSVATRRVVGAAPATPPDRS